MLLFVLTPLSLGASDKGRSSNADREQPIEVRARSVEVNEKTGVSVYRGDVIVRQGSLELRGDLVEIRTRDKKPERIDAYGKPATARQGDDVLTAAEIHYDVNEQLLRARAPANANGPRVHAVFQPPNRTAPHEPAAR